AAIIHLAVAPQHLQEWWGYGLFFLVVAVVQALTAIGLLAPKALIWPARWNVLVGLLGNLGLVGIYLVSRTAGIPLLGPHAGEVESVGVLDLGATVLELGVVAWLARRLFPQRAPGPSTSAPPRLVLRLSLGALVALVACTVAPQPPSFTPAPTSSPIPAGHEAEGLALGSEANTESVYAAARCPAAAPLRQY